MPHQIVITTGARLHFGPLSYAPNSPRHFGGVGAMIDSPRFVVATSASERDEVIGPDAAAARARQVVAAYRERCPPEHQPPPCHVEIRSEIPAHVGLGSGTQLAMAVGEALLLMTKEWRSSPVQLAPRVGRGKRSAVGCHGFDLGGLIVDGGLRGASSLGACVVHHTLPDPWRFLLIAPAGTTGLAGDSETDAFARLPPMPQATTDRLCRLVLMELLPAVLESDCDAAGEALYGYGRLVGEYFAPVQGGTYGHPQMRGLVPRLRDGGVPGVGQTSWGPTIFALLPDQPSAECLHHDLVGEPRWSDCQFRIACPLNTGAVIEVG